MRAIDVSGRSGPNRRVRDVVHVCAVLAQIDLCKRQSRPQSLVSVQGFGVPKLMTADLQRSMGTQTAAGLWRFANNLASSPNRSIVGLERCDSAWQGTWIGSSNGKPKVEPPESFADHEAAVPHSRLSDDSG